MHANRAGAFVNLKHRGKRTNNEHAGMDNSGDDGWSDCPESDSASKQNNSPREECTIDRGYSDRKHHVGIGRRKHALPGRSQILERDESGDERPDRAQLSSLFCRQAVDNAECDADLLVLLRAQAKSQDNIESDLSPVFRFDGVALPPAFQRAAVARGLVLHPIGP